MVKENDKKVAMMIAASKALEYKKQNPSAIIEEVMQHIINSINVERDAKIAAIASANKAIKYKEQAMKDKEIMQKIMNESDQILREIEAE